jgi:uncharacterized protein (PEP-CTERM system associated)
MTIITAERPRAGLPARLKLAPLALAALLLSAQCRADWKFTPLVDLRESYTDNVGLQPDELAHNEFISEVAPGFALTSNGPRLTLSASGQWRRYAYSDNDAPNTFDSERRYQATGRAMLVDNLFYVDGGASSSRQVISAFGQIATNSYSSANRTDVSTWRISPYLQHRFGSTATGTLRFTRDSVDAGADGFGSSVASTSSVDVASGTAFTTFGWYGSFFRQELSNRIAGSSTSSNGTVGLNYRVLPHFSLTANAGYDDYEYASLNQRTGGPSWSAGFAWNPSTRTSVQASFGHRYFGKTGSLAASHYTRNTVWSLNYSDQVTTTRSQFLLPAAVDTAAMLNSLFAAAYPDPVQRQAAVQAYIAATGLPTSLANNINYLSNRYIRAKRLQGAVILRGSRSNLTLSAFNDQSAGLSIQESDSTLLGSQLATLNDNVRQRGASANAEYRLSPRMTALASIYAVRVQSIETNVVNNSLQYRIGLTRRLDAKTSGNVEVRRLRGSLGLNSTEAYHENAVAATLSVRF